MDGNCNAATNAIQSIGMEPIFSHDNQDKDNPLHLTILERSQNKEIIVAFSGTQHFKQLVEQARHSSPRDYHIHNVGSAQVFKFFYRSYLENFRTLIQEKLNTIANDQKYNGYTIIFTGHSLGGALCLHAAADAVLGGVLNNHKVSVYTYGQPRVGDKNFVDSFINKLDEYFRLTHYRDIVPHLPPCVPNFHSGCVEKGSLPVYPYHAPREVYYSKNMRSYKVCSSSEGEDSSCSDDHINNRYVNISN